MQPKQIIYIILLNELVESDKMQGLSSILSFFRNEFNESVSTNIRFYLSYDTKNSLKSYFWRKTL